MIAPEEKQAAPFVTPGISFAFVATTAVGLIRAATSWDVQLSAPRLALIVALGSAYALLGTAGVYLVQQRGTKLHLYVILGVSLAVGASAVLLSQGGAFLLLMPLVFYGVLLLTPAGATAVVIVSTAITLSAWVVRGLSASELPRELAIWFAPLVFTLVVSRMILLQRRQTAAIEELAKTKERNRIARDIHDGLGHYLTVVHVQLEAAQALIARDPKAAREALGKAQTLTREGLAEVRRSVALLRSSKPQRPLVAAIEKLADECSADGIKTELKLTGSPRPLPEPVEITLYRAAQEALTNVRRHARASHLSIELTFAPSEGIRLRVEDDGVGADPVGQGFGLIGLRERAESVGGKIAVRSARGQGFRLEVELPG
jgi:signal transduction histidine kinase